MKAAYAGAMVLVLAALMVAPAAAVDCEHPFKLDVGIFEKLNGQDNPVHEHPYDQTPISFTVTWIVKRTNINGMVLPGGSTTVIGTYTATQDGAATACGPYDPYIVKEGSWCIPWTGICLAHIYEEGYYHIGYNYVPKGYCPQYPNGQDRKKSDTTTVNMNFYLGSGCGGIFPPPKAYILIQ